MGKTFRVAALFAVYSGVGFGGDYAMGLLAQEDAVGKIEVEYVTGDVEIEVEEDFLVAEWNETNGKISPDGRWIAYQSDESGENRVYVHSFPVITGRQSVSPGLGEVTEYVLIVSDGSGSIEVEDIGGDFVVDQDGGGDIRCSDVSGQVELPDDRRIPDEQRRRRRRRHPCR